MSEKVSLLLGGKRFQFWEDVKIDLSLDSIDTFSFTTPFLADDKVFREQFRPFTYSSLEIRIDDGPLLTGFILSKSSAVGNKTLSLGGYSRPGLLNDLPVPRDKYPIEFKEQTLSKIAATLGGYYDIDVNFDVSPGAKFSPQVGLEPPQKVLEFLIRLAQKRSLLVGNTLEGKLNFFVPGKSRNNTPLVQGQPPLLSATASYNEQEMFSSVTGLGKSDAGRDPESFTFPIPILKGIDRPFIYTVSDALGAELQSAVKFKAGRLFAGAISITVNVSDWRGANGKIWTPGDFITLQAPDIFFYNETRLMIKNVSLSQQADNDSASMNLIFPGVYSGELPEKMPWD